MLITVFLFNKPNRLQIPMFLIIFLSFPSHLIFCYLLYKCNQFLWIYPFNETLIFICINVYLYILIYIGSEF